MRKKEEKSQEPYTCNWDSIKVKSSLELAFNNNSEIELLQIIKANSFLLYELYSRKWGIQPSFHEINFGSKLRCDFAWLNDNSDGPEWVLLEIEKPKMKLFTKKGEPSAELNHAIEQVKTWQRYFEENPLEKKRIFGAVARFRFILVAGSKEDWSTESAIKWRKHHNATSDIEIRSSDIFYRAISILERSPSELWSFNEHPKTLSHSRLEKYWEKYGYMDIFRRIL
ncbi:Shedu anti-phage system protein SduA domain-containing protein [Myroides odoratimimus]|uniref:Shedu anti-phage system protein SduA domain-containing protein n=1 Tax=Myroides odoratimimus TaxID=76832 RepID=UPI002DB62795|nr:Shedu anti-phage system protein SduA domain-containing protein [Myroides odoratimimus]MEC4054568.1 Shedu anti-phage system protein SduA domain-containing protein [Myroides odoratimimus]